MLEENKNRIVEEVRQRIELDKGYIRGILDKSTDTLYITIYDIPIFSYNSIGDMYFIREFFLIGPHQPIGLGWEKIDKECIRNRFEMISQYLPKLIK